MHIKPCYMTTMMPKKRPIKDLLGIAPVIILSAVDNPQEILNALESGARGYIPTATTSLDLTIEIIRLVRADGTFVPTSSLSLQRYNGEGSTSRLTTTEQFTPPNDGPSLSNVGKSSQDYRARTGAERGYN
jgi:DNA-binding NarL/FixJ family response regulator